MPGIKPGMTWRGGHSPFTPALRMISDHLASSAAMSAAYSSGLTGSASAPSTASRRLHLVACQRGVERGVQLRHHRERRAGRREQALPGQRLETRIARLNDGRHVRKQRMALQRGHRQRADLSAFCGT